MGRSITAGETARPRSSRGTRLERRLRAIIATQQEIAEGALDLQAVLDLVVRRARELTDADAAVVEMAEDDEMVYRAVAGTAEGYLGLRLGLYTSISGLCVRTGQMLRCDDSETDERVDREACRKVGARSMIMVPLVHAGVTQGALKVYTGVPSAFDEDDIDTLTLLAGQIAAALKTATAFSSAEHRAFHDPLTDLANRALLYDRMALALAAARRQSTPVAFLLVDLDGFKPVNDLLGHQVGDMLLQEIAARLRGTVRESDTVARLGGDEFALLLPGTDTAGAAHLARKVNDAVQQPVDMDGHQIRVRGSVGVAVFPEHAAELDELLQRADAAMYRAKRSHSGIAVAMSEPGNSGYE